MQGPHNGNTPMTRRRNINRIRPTRIITIITHKKRNFEENGSVTINSHKRHTNNHGNMYAKKSKKSLGRMLMAIITKERKKNSKGSMKP